MIKLYFLPIILLLLFYSGTAQPTAGKIGDVTWEELRQTYYPGDSTAPAAILSDVGRSVFVYDDNHGFRVDYSRTVKIKIYSTEGLDWGNVAIGYYDGGYKQEIVTDIQGITTNDENGQLVQTELDKKAVYQTDISEHGRVTKFALPNVRVGSVVQYTYTVRSPYLFTLREWQFQYEIPVRYSEFRARIPAFYEYSIIYHGYAKLSVNDAEVKRDKLRLGQYTYSNVAYRWVTEDVPAFNDEAFISAKEDYLSRLTFQLAKENFPGRSTREYMETWPKLSSDLLSLSDYGKYLRKKDGYDKAQQLTTQATSEIDKAQAIYQYISNTLAWDGTVSLTPHQSPKQVLATKTGNSSDINIVLSNMLRAVGIITKPVLLSTREHGQVTVKYPILDQFNYSVVHARIDGHEYLLDGTDPDLPLGVLPLRCINGYGLIVDKKEERWVALESSQNYQSEIFVFANFDSVSHSLLAEVKCKARGYAALDFRKTYRKNQEEITGFGAQNLVVTNIDDIGKDVLVTFNTPYPATPANEFVYIDPFYYSMIDENPFKAEKRQHPVQL